MPEENLENFLKLLPKSSLQTNLMLHIKIFGKSESPSFHFKFHPHFKIFSDHFVSVGAISAGDGSQYDFIRAMDHYNKLLMGTGPNKTV